MDCNVAYGNSQRLFWCNRWFHLCLGRTRLGGANAPGNYIVVTPQTLFGVITGVMIAQTYFNSVQIGAL